jgi:hypothetical protein
MKNKLLWCAGVKNGIILIEPGDTLASAYLRKSGTRIFTSTLLFYHTRLHCYIIIELKIGAFVPEFAGKLNFYLSASDDLLRDPAIDQPTIGILLCREKNRVIAEYALRDMSEPMAVSTYHLGHTLPPKFQEQLPDTDRLKDILLGVCSRFGSDGSSE